MRNLFTVTKNEFLRYFTSPLAYVYLLSFLLLNGSFAFYFGGFFSRMQASLDSMFAFQPWLYLIFVPGIAMRLWAEEFRNKTIIQIITMPISTNTLVWGKFLAAWIFCGIALVLTFPFWITINYLGNPDNSVVMIAYLASFSIAGCMLAISGAMSAITKNQVIALVLSVFANLMFFLSGLEFVLALVRTIAPISIVDMLASFSFITHFDTMSRGLVELRDIVFFVSIIILFNLLTTLIVSFKTSGTSKLFKSNNKNYYIALFFFVLLGFIGTNLIANNYLRNYQKDFTEEKLFTLSKSTLRVLDKMPNNVIAKLYYSPILGQRNHDVRLMFDRIRILLDRYSVASNGKFSYKVYSPRFLDRHEDEALANGIQPIPIIDLNQNAFFGLSLSDEVDNKNEIPFFPLQRSSFVEQDITQKIYQLYHEKKNIGIITSLNIGDTSVSETAISPKWEIINQIEQFYNVNFIKNETDFDNHKSDILMIVHPQELPVGLVDRIKEFTTNGGKLFVALDAATETSRILITDKPKFTPSDLSGLDELWGFKFYNNLAIADLDNSITVDVTQNYQTTPKFTQDVIQPKLRGKSINKQLVETANLKSILMTSISPISPINDDIYFIPLLTASSNSQLISIDIIYNHISPIRILRAFQADKHFKVIAARILSKDPKKPYEMIVVGDTDFMYDSFWSETTNLLNKNYVIPILDNANFVLNSLDVLSGDLDLIDIRGRTAEIREFEDIEKIRKTSQKDFSVKESEILNKIEIAKTNLQEIWNKRDFEGRDIFSADELAMIANVRKNLDNLRQELSSIKTSSNEEIENIEVLLKFINIYLVPAVIVLYLIIYGASTSKKTTNKRVSLSLNREFYLISLISLMLLSFGIASVYITDRNDIDKYEDKPVFLELKNNINDVRKIKLKTHNDEITFIKEKDKWVIDGKEFPVYQERIRSFLSALIEASYYEKKSDKVENLSRFGLRPIKDEKSTATRIEISNKDDKIVTAFEVGDFDISIGRGAKAAYIKFDNKFQVWLIAVDFIDLSSNWKDWTYSTLWNLRFGRVQNINNIEDDNISLNVMKDIINIHFENVDDLEDKSKFVNIRTIVISTEDDDQTKINIFSKADDFYVNYEFPEKTNNRSLEFFAKNNKESFYKIANEDKEKIKNVIELTKQ